MSQPKKEHVTFIHALKARLGEGRAGAALAAWRRKSRGRDQLTQNQATASKIKTPASEKART